MRGTHNTDYVINFYNDRVKEAVDVLLMAEPFTYVPIKAGHMELVGGNAVVFGKITEGYDEITPLIDIELTYENISTTTAITDLVVLIKRTIISLVHYTMSGAIVIVLPTEVQVGSTYFINILNEEVDPEIDISVFYVAVGGDTLADIKLELENRLTTAGAVVATGSPDNQIYIYEITRSWGLKEPNMIWVQIESLLKKYVVTAYIGPFGLSSKFIQLKTGAVHGFGIVYKDRAGRQCSVMKTDVMSIYIPFYAEETDNLLETIVKLVFKIYHKPPSWAETYEIVYYGNLSMDWFLQIRADDITDISNDRYSLNINQTLEATWKANSRWRVPAYTWQAGDRLRLLGTVDIVTGVVAKYTTLYDYEIEVTGEQDGSAINGDWLWFQAKDHPVLFVGETNILVEIYHPRKGLGKTVSYGSGMVFKIETDSYGNKYHKGNIDQVFNSSGLCVVVAEIDNTAYDCWKFQRLNYKYAVPPVTVLPFWAEGFFPSDWWGGQTVSARLTSCGFPFLDDLSQRQTILDERIRHGGYLITGTRTNNIAHFTFLDYLDLPKKNGDITGLREVGFTLKVIQMHKETSIYINRIQTFNPDGTEQFTLTDKFLAEQRPMESDYGCQHPNSIMVNGRDLYYWDNNEGAFIRSSPNGQKVLSGPEYKMTRWFKDLLKWIQLSGGRDLLVVNIGANNEHEEIWATFRIGDEIQGFIFSEKRGRFVSRLNQITESYLHLGNFFAHLYQQRLWIMNVNEEQDWLSWSGTPTYALVEVVSNIEPLKNKVFNALAVFADHLLQSLAKYIHIPAEASGGNELMESNAPILDRREGIYFGEIMKDENSKGNFVDVYDRKLNGREMRGRYCYVKFYTDEHDEKVRIDSIAVFSTLSERNV